MKQHENNIQTSFEDKLICRKEAARLLGVSPQTLAQWACSKRVLLPYIKLGSKVMYSLKDIGAFIASNTHGLSLHRDGACRGE
jgi:DNA-binding XRE family transcriptional regulator